MQKTLARILNVNMHHELSIVSTFNWYNSIIDLPFSYETGLLYANLRSRFLFIWQVLSFPTNCPLCNAPAETRMKLVGILIIKVQFETHQP